MLNEENENRRWTTMDDGAFRFGTFTQRVKGWLRVSRFLSASMVVYLRFNCRFQVYGVIDSGAGGSSNRGRFEAKWPSGSRRSAKPMWQTLLGVAFVSGTFAGGTRGSPSQAYAKYDESIGLNSPTRSSIMPARLCQIRRRIQASGTTTFVAASQIF